jgi:hypothetical protein
MDNMEPGAIGMVPLQRRGDLGLIAQQGHFQIQFGNGLHSPGYQLDRSMISAHDIQGNMHFYPLLQIIAQLDHGSVLIRAAASAEPVRQLWLAAL